MITLYSTLCNWLATFRPNAAAFVPDGPLPVWQQLELDLDRMTDTGLVLRDAMAVRSAEFWLALGEPALALKEMENLKEAARTHGWALRTQLRVQTATASLA